MIWWWIAYEDLHDNMVGGCFIEAPSILPDRAVVALASMRHLVPETPEDLTADVRKLPDLVADRHVPRSFFDRLLGVEDLRQIDIILKGDGTFTVPVSMRGFEL